jgi:hypothetical protein
MGGCAGGCLAARSTVTQYAGRQAETKESFPAMTGKKARQERRAFNLSEDALEKRESRRDIASMGSNDV